MVETSPSATNSPALSRIARWQSEVMAAMLWLTKRTVRPLAGDVAHFAEAFFLELRRRRRRALHRRSGFRGSRWAATANARRTYMPLL